jgi:hypothetical protein
MDSGSTRRKPHGQCLRIHLHMTKREQHGTDTNTGSHGPEHFQCKRSCSNESFGRCFLTRCSGINTILVDVALVSLAARPPLIDLSAILPSQAELKCIFVVRQNCARALHPCLQDRNSGERIFLWKLP